jgi:hypothetical protein
MIEDFGFQACYLRLFTMVTFLFTIQISQAEEYQSRFAASILIGYETMILPKPAG